MNFLEIIKIAISAEHPGIAALFFNPKTSELLQIRQKSFTQSLKGQYRLLALLPGLVNLVFLFKIELVQCYNALKEDFFIFYLFRRVILFTGA